MTARILAHSLVVPAIMVALLGSCLPTGNVGESAAASSVASDPTGDPTGDPTVEPTADPTVDPTAQPTSEPTVDPTVTPTPGPPSGQDTRPNLVVILTDDMRADDLKYMPLTRKRIQATGINFTRAISPHPICCPARAELLTGQYAQNNGVLHNAGKYGAFQAFDGTNAAATWFQAQGYSTAFVGKYINHYKMSHPAEPGWDHWGAIPQGYADYFNFTFHDGKTYKNDYVTTRIEQRTNTTLRALSKADKPFLYYVNHVAPHDRQPRGAEGLTFAPAHPKDRKYKPRGRAPMLTKPSFLKKVKGGLPDAMRTQTGGPSDYYAPHGRGYYKAKWLARVRSLQAVDRAVESMFRTLDATGEADNTYVAFTSDNGYSLGEHILYRKNLLTAEGLAVPLLVTGPHIENNTTSRLPVTLVDLVATLTDLGDITPGRTLDGLSFAPTMHGDKRQTWRDTTLIQTGSERVKGPQPGWGMRGVRTDRYAYGYDVKTGQEFLFDHARDRHELINQAKNDTYRKVTAELAQRTKRLIDCAGNACNRTFGKAPKPGRGKRPGRR